MCIADSIPGVGGDKDDDAGQTKEELQEQERLRQEAIKEAERDRRIKYKKQEEERETIRAGIREKVRKVNNLRKYNKLSLQKETYIYLSKTLVRCNM